MQKRNKKKIDKIFCVKNEFTMNNIGVESFT